MLGQIFQSQSLLTIDTPLGPDSLFVRSIRYQDAVGRPFKIHLDLISEFPDLDLTQLIGKYVEVKSRFMSGKRRSYCGLVSKASYRGPSAQRYHIYTATVRPTFWFLKQTSDCRIYKDKTIPDIIKMIFEERGLVYAPFALSSDWWSQSRDFIVQYRESYFNFVSRLMEREGYFYVVRHKDGSDELAMADSIAGLSNPYGSIEYNPLCPADDTSGKIMSLKKSIRFRPGTVALLDYNYLNVSATMEGSATDPVTTTQSSYEVFDYPGKYDAQDQGDHYASVRLEQLRMQREILHANASVPTLAPGDTFTLTNHPSAAFNNKKYHVIGADYVLVNAEFDGELASADTVLQTNSCNVTLIPEIGSDGENVEFRTAPKARKPKIRGPQTAVVVGYPAEGAGDSEPDEHGRVRVRFFWDRYALQRRDGLIDCCWIRVSETWAGNGYGSSHIPHIGHEVIVEFLEGDPDRPIITGRVYNGQNVLPFQLPRDKHRTVVSQDWYGNQIIFDATPGAEQIQIHSPDANSTIVLDKDGSSATTQANKNEVTVGNKREINIGNSVSISLGGAFTAEGGAKAEVFVGASAEFNLAFGFEAVVGSKVELSFASTFSLSKGFNFESSTASDIKRAEEDVSSFAEKHHHTCGQAGVTVTAGGAGAAGPTALISLAPTTATIAVGMAGDGAPASKMVSRAWPLLASAIAGVAAGASAVLVGTAAMKFVTQPEDDSKTKDDESDYQGKHIEAKPYWIAGTACGVAALVAAGIQVALCHKLAKAAELAMTTKLSDTDVAPRLEITGAPAPGATLAVGAANAGSAVELSATAATTKFGPSNKIVVDAQGVAITVGPSTFTVKPGMCAASAQLINLG